jgi:type III restriction enzyme
MKISSIDQVPEDIHDSLRQSLLVLDHAEKTQMSDYAHAFQPLLSCLDDYSMRLLVSGLQSRVPADVASRDAYFMPDLSAVISKKRNVLEKYGKYLRDNLVFARSIMRLGTLLFCLEYAQKGGFGASGVWKDVVTAYSGTKMKELYDLLSDVNEFRNKRVAHVEYKLSDVNEAWENMGKWVKCLSMMDSTL